MNGSVSSNALSSSTTGLAAASSAGTSLKACNHCNEKKSMLPYIFPMQAGKKEFCSEPCLSSYRSAHRGQAIIGNIENNRSMFFQD